MLKILRAIEVAIEAHGFTSRKLHHVPYVIHPVRVMRSVESYLETFPSAFPFKPLRETMLIVAALHDVEEDTGYSMDEIEKEFGKEVREGVRWLTSLSKQTGTYASDGTPLKDKKRKERKLVDLK